MGSSQTHKTYCTSLWKTRRRKRERERETENSTSVWLSEKKEGVWCLSRSPEINQSVHFHSLPAELLVPSRLTWRMSRIGFPPSFERFSLFCGKNKQDLLREENLARPLWIIWAQTSVSFIFFKPTHESITCGQYRVNKLWFSFSLNHSNKPSVKKNNYIICRPGFPLRPVI